MKIYKALRSFVTKDGKSYKTGAVIKNMDNPGDLLAAKFIEETKESAGPVTTNVANNREEKEPDVSKKSPEDHVENKNTNKSGKNRK